MGAPGAPFAPVLLADRRRPRRVRAAGRGGTALPRLGEVLDRRDRARGVRRVRTARAGRNLPLSPAEALALWSDVERWSSFVEGFARRLELTPDWPAAGARVVWESTPDGRGRVTQTLRARRASNGSEIELTLDYELAKYGPLAGIADAIFIRRALRDALRRTLFRFGIEAEDELGLR